MLCLETFCLWAQGTLREGWRKSLQQKQCGGRGVVFSHVSFEEGPRQAGAVPTRLSKLAQAPPRGGQVLAMAALSDMWGQAVVPQIQDSSGYFGGSPPESSSDKA